MLSLSLLSLATAAPPTTQDALESWWLAAGQITLGDTVYRIGDEPVVLADNVCEFTLTEGAMIPVYSGTAPVSERMIGLVWLGEGSSELSFNERGDVLAFANHMAINGGAAPEEFRDLLETRAVNILQPDCSHAGGISSLHTACSGSCAFSVHVRVSTPSSEKPSAQV